MERKGLIRLHAMQSGLRHSLKESHCMNHDVRIDQIPPNVGPSGETHAEDNKL